MNSILMNLKTSSLRLAASLGAAVTLSAQTPPEVSLTVRGEQITHTMRGGIGASWHAIEAEIPTGVKHPVFAGPAHGGSAWGGNPPAEDNARWTQIERHADWLGLDFIRVEVEQRMWQPERERFTWDGPEMRILYRILDWCESRQADVFFQVMWPHFTTDRQALQRAGLRNTRRAGGWHQPRLRGGLALPQGQPDVDHRQ